MHDVMHQKRRLPNEMSPQAAVTTAHPYTVRGMTGHASLCVCRVESLSIAHPGVAGTSCARQSCVYVCVR